MSPLSAVTLLCVIVVLRHQVQKVDACVGDTGLYCAVCGNVGPNWNVCASCLPGHGGRGCCACGQPPGKACPSARHCFGGHRCLTHCCTSGISAACQECNSTGNCSKCDNSTHYLDPGTANCEPLVVNGGNCTNSIACDSSDCRGGTCCSKWTVARCITCGPSGECEDCGGGFHLEATTCCLNNVSNCAKCNDVGWCSVCKPGWTLRGITCIPSPTVPMSMTVSISETVTPPPTETKSPKATLSESPIFSMSSQPTVSLTTTVTPHATTTKIQVPSRSLSTKASTTWSRTTSLLDSVTISASALLSTSASAAFSRTTSVSLTACSSTHDVSRSISETLLIDGDS